MSNPVCPQLDYVWFAFLVMASVGTATLVPGVVVTLILRATQARRLKAMWRILWTQTLLLSALGLAGVWWQKGPDCFASAFAGGTTALTRMAAIAWLAGVGLFLVVDLARLALAYWQRRAWQVTECKEFDELKERFGLRRARLAIGELGPLVMWGWTACVIVPQELMRALNGVQRRAILAHELAHVAAHDLWWAWPELILRRLLFFHPAMWLASSLHAEVQEVAADELALRALRISPREYAETFLALIAWTQAAGPAPLASMSAISNFRCLERRLKYLSGHSEKRPGIWTRVLMTMALCGSMTAAMAQARAFGWGPSAEGGQCVQARHEKFLEDVFHMKREPKTCEQGEK